MGTVVMPQAAFAFPDAVRAPVDTWNAVSTLDMLSPTFTTHTVTAAGDSNHGAHSTGNNSSSHDDGSDGDDQHYSNDRSGGQGDEHDHNDNSPSGGGGGGANDDNNGDDDEDNDNHNLDQDDQEEEEEEEEEEDDDEEEDQDKVSLVAIDPSGATKTDTAREGKRSSGSAASSPSKRAKAAMDTTRDDEGNAISQEKGEEHVGGDVDTASQHAHDAGATAPGAAITTNNSNNDPGADGDDSNDDNGDRGGVEDGGNEREGDGNNSGDDDDDDDNADGDDEGDDDDDGDEGSGDGSGDGSSDDESGSGSSSEEDDPTATVISGQTMRYNLERLNPYLMCRLCDGYLIDATTLSECLHTFCKSCIVNFFESNNSCPVCGTLAHEINPHDTLRQDRTMQTIVYKLVPGLLEDETHRRRVFEAELNGEELPSPTHDTAAGDDESNSAHETDDEEARKEAEARLKKNPELQVSFMLEPEELSEDIEKMTPRNHGAKEKLERPFVRTSAKATIMHLKKFLAHRLKLAGAEEVDVLCRGEALGKEYTIEYVLRTRWRKPSQLMLTYRPHIDVGNDRK
ncbi:hypothetical protein PTSG_09210 [Salpingoeca rosetta]|uniref:RING-type domain-containing protein n=1 Tax=Salpingoeca rosetta (strain ATCC 50818 / BSB-021) TaxID=946362 RepID=F2UN13_SALR5|nr:uncharacterized protein PTSG_09210 [Salpingoeca rosetta]EGD78512.1 hypothetical protein PTSG_09210 [Salpingoeca rosetta]|eukprot:XP_004989461.1 hypothetical protein PTSG_09210 [Salpingoeca rosetta]